MIERHIQPLFERLRGQYPVLTLTGPRQSGKTTLAKACCPGKPYVTLEDPDIRRHALDDPRGFLATHASSAILDEIQRAPELPSYLQGMVDADTTPGRFVLTGSHQFELMDTVAQSLAGRTALLRGEAEGGQILVSDVVARRAADAAVTRQLGPLVLKGFAAAQDAFAVVVDAEAGVGVPGNSFDIA